MKMRHVLIPATLCTIAYGLYKLSQEKNTEYEEIPVPKNVIPFSKFQDESIVVDQVNGCMISEWVKSQPETDGSVCIVAYPTKEVLEKFTIVNCPDELDPESNLLQFILDLNNSRLLKARLISFGNLSDKVKDLFCGEKYFIVKN